MRPMTMCSHNLFSQKHGDLGTRSIVRKGKREGVLYFHPQPDFFHIPDGGARSANKRRTRNLVVGTGTAGQRMRVELNGHNFVTIASFQFLPPGLFDLLPTTMCLIHPTSLALTMIVNSYALATFSST